MKYACTCNFSIAETPDDGRLWPEHVLNGRNDYYIILNYLLTVIGLMPGGSVTKIGRT
jgi:hypothetical protein